MNIQQEPTSGDITLLPQKTGLIYRTSLIYCFNDAESLYYIDKDYNFYAFHIPRIEGIGIKIYTLPVRTDPDNILKTVFLETEHTTIDRQRVDDLSHFVDLLF